MTETNGLFGRTTFLVKERVAVMKLTDTYDILDPESGETIALARENPGGLTKVLRLIVNKRLMPTRVEISEGVGRPPVLSIRRGFALFRQRVDVFGADDAPIGYFKTKAIAFRAGFGVFDHEDNEIARVKGDWKGWNFTFTTSAGEELGKVTKKWGGIGKELFTSADTYVIHIEGEPRPAKVALLLAAGLAIDVIYAER